MKEEKNKDRRWYSSYPDDVSQIIEKPNRTVYMLLDKTVNKFGNRTAIISDDGQEISYEKLKESVDRLANAWHKMGLVKGERIGLMLANTPYYIIAYYAAAKLGLIIVQINPNYTVRELLRILSNSSTKNLVIQEESLEKINKVSDMHNLDNLFLTESITRENKVLQQMIKSTEPLEIFIDVNVEDVAIIQYTGGTTGEVKGVMLTHSNLVANVLQNHTIFGNQVNFGTEKFLIATPLYHVYAMTSAMNLGIYLGATNILIERYHIDETLKKIKRYQPTYFPGVPRMYSDIVHHPQAKEYDINSLRVCSSGSAPLPVEIIKKFEDLTGAVIAEGYGLSEASPSTHRNPVFGVRKIGSIGVPLPSTDCKIVDDDDQELPPNMIGELIIKGPQVMKGYWRNNKESLSALRDGWLYTGDLARQDKDGYFYIVGRKQEMIISNGFNVYPQEVENILYELPDVLEAAVIGIPDSKNGERVKAFIVLREDSDLTIDELKGHCYKELTPYKVPKTFNFIKELPRNNVGKVLKTELVKKSISNYG